MIQAPTALSGTPIAPGLYTSQEKWRKKAIGGFGDAALQHLLRPVGKAHPGANKGGRRARSPEAQQRQHAQKNAGKRQRHWDVTVANAPKKQGVASKRQQ